MENTNPNTCGVMEGSLPGKCASMVFPYISMQGMNAERYDQTQGLAAGTLFPGLNLPFFKALGFAITELGLYLDTHRDDKEALALYTDYVNLAKEGRKRYEAAYGPLQQTDVTTAGYTWLNEPWPWEFDGGRK